MQTVQDVGGGISALQTLFQAGIHGPPDPGTDQSDLNRDFLNFLGPGPVRDFQIFLGPGAVRDFLNFVGPGSVWSQISQIFSVLVRS